MTDFYDWDKTRTYDADITMVIGARGIGKTYGLRKCFVRDFLRRGIRFAEIARYRDDCKAMALGYFDRISADEEFAGHIFRSDSTTAYIADKPTDGGRPKWHACGYFVAMTQAQSLKKKTFADVSNVCFDEAVLDRRDRYHSYLPGEFEILANLVDTLSRERADMEGRKPHVYLLGNAVDVLNPYFAAYKISDPRRGYSWHGGKTMLLDFVPAGEYGREKATGTVAGRMLAGLRGGAENIDNRFTDIAQADYISRKPPRAVCECGLVYGDIRMGVWTDVATGLLYLTAKIPKGVRPVYAMTLADQSLDTIAARNALPAIKRIVMLHGFGLCRFDGQATYQAFLRLATLFGWRTM